MKKRLLALLLACVFVFALAACGGGNETPAASTSPSTAPAPSADVPDAAPEAIVWPTDDVTVYIPADVGAPLDLASRVLIDYLTDKTGGTFIAENDSTGGGARLAELTSSSTGDANVLMSCGCGQIVSFYNGTWTVNLADSEKFSVIAPNIGQQIPSGGVFVTQPDAPYNTLEEFVDYVKANPNTVTVAIVNGTPHEVRLKLITEYYGISDQVRWVSCTNNDALTGLLGGSINLGCLTETVGPQYVADGSLKALLNSRIERGYADDALKETLDGIPIVTDVIDGDCSDLVVTWPMLVVGPGGLDEATCEYINGIISDIVNSEEYMERIRGLGGTNTYQPMSLEEIRGAVSDADVQISEIFASFND